MPSVTVSGSVTIHGGLQLSACVWRAGTNGVRQFLAGSVPGAYLQSIMTTAPFAFLISALVTLLCNFKGEKNKQLSPVFLTALLFTRRCLASSFRYLCLHHGLKRKKKNVFFKPRYGRINREQRAVQNSPESFSVFFFYRVRYSKKEKRSSLEPSCLFSLFFAFVVFCGVQE